MLLEKIVCRLLEIQAPRSDRAAAQTNCERSHRNVKHPFVCVWLCVFLTVRGPEKDFSGREVRRITRPSVVGVHGNRRRSVRKEGVHGVASTVRVYKLFYGKPLKDARAAAARAHTVRTQPFAVRLELMTAAFAPTGLFREVTSSPGVDAAGSIGWSEQRIRTRSSRSKYMIREFHRHFPGICGERRRRAVLGVSRDSITGQRMAGRILRRTDRFAHYQSSNPRCR